MTLVTTSLWMPDLSRHLITTYAFVNTTAMAATGNKTAFIGRVWHPTRSTSAAVHKVGFRFGSSITKAGGSGLTVSLQDVDLTNGPPNRPDGTQDQTVAIANADASFAASTWYQTGALSADRTVAHGDLLAVVVEYDGSGRLGADSVTLSVINTASSAPLDSGVSTNTGGTWSSAALANCVILEFADGAFGTLDFGVPISAVGSDTFQSTSNPEIIGLEFQLPFPCKCDGAWAVLNINSGADFTVQLYDGNSVIASAATDSNAIASASATRQHIVTFPEQSLSANHTYRIGIKPTTANAVTLSNFSVAAAGHLGAHVGGTTWQYNTFHTSAWGSPTPTKRPLIGLRLSAVDDGTGSGSSVIGVIGG